MKINLFKNLFDFKIEKDMKVSISDNEIYNQLLLYIFSREKRDLIIITPNLNEANKLFFKLKNYYDDTYIFPDDDYLTKKAIASSPDLLYMRMNLLNNLSSKDEKIVICPINSFLKKLPDYKKFKDLSINIKANDIVDRNDLISKLLKIGYKRDTVVTNTGEFSVRGFVIDIFPINEDHPIRIEFFDNEVEAIKYFDEFTQLSICEINDIVIKPIVDEYEDATSNILQYLNNPLAVIEDINKIIDAIKNIKEQAKYYDDYEDYSFDISKIDNKIYVDLFDNYDDYSLTIKAEEILNYNENYDKFIEDIINKKGILYSANNKFNDTIKNKPIKIIEESLNKGFKYKDNYYFSINDLKKSAESYSYNIKYKLGKRITNIENLSIGDYVVHKSYGIGVYMGIATITKNGLQRDYILLQYKGTDKLYIPVDKLDKLYKYSSKDGARPNLQKLNNDEWEKVKDRIKTKIKEISGELIKIYKERTQAKVTPYDADNDMQLLFESEFPYEETPDQLKAIKEIKRDLESSKPMDRLLCGDVGYGKTEVIFRAMFKTVFNNKQVMYLCPTTLLSQQQYENSIKRFSNYGVSIAILNRYVTPSKSKQILEDFSNGKIDILFGTHRLLSDDVKPQKLGLLVIDEEQRFGVIHKEKIKKYKSNVHILSVSATPIPRSLQMSLTGIRDLSLIETAPKNRYPIQTYVIAYDEQLLKEAILKEISRNGQIFILYNKIKNMGAFVLKLEHLMPNVTIRYAHGKMNKDQIQDIMTDFYDNKFSVLISTTIIENGIDIPNANTMIVMDSDLFGLSQLYQIRGRVGRSDKIAYTYLMYNKANILTESATKRLNAIKEFTELGSGYKIAMRDLSIRGAGDMLGTEQAGFIDSVGVDLYLELINEELNNIIPVEDNKDIIIDDVSTHISEKYSNEDELIIEIHSKINSIDSDEKFEEVEKEILDRFGLIDEKIRTYMIQEYVEKLLDKLSIKILINDQSKISLKIDDKIYAKLNIEELFIETSRINTKFAFVYRDSFIIISLLKLKYDEHYLNYILKLLKYIQKEVN